jgi:WD40 repeat protein
MDSSEEVQLYDVGSQELIRSFKDEPSAPLLIEELAFTPDGKRLVAANAVPLANRFVGAVLIWDVESGKLQQRLAETGVRPRALAMSVDGDFLAAADWDTSVQIWNLKTGKSLATGVGHTGLIRSVSYTPSSGQMLTAAEDYTARLWEVSTRTEVARLPHEHGVRTAALSPDGKLAATGGLNDTVLLWNLPDGTKRHEWKGKRSLGGAWQLNFTPDGGEVVALMDDLQLHRWSTQADAATTSLQLLPTDLRTMRVGARPANAQTDSRFDREELGDVIAATAVSPDSSHVVLAGGDNQYWIFNTVDGEERAHRKLPFYPAALTVSPNGRRIAVGGRGKSLWSSSGTTSTEKSSDLAVFDFDSGDVLWTITLKTACCGPVRFSPDGRWLTAMTSEESQTMLRFYDAANGNEVHVLRGTQTVGTDESFAFSPDGMSFAAAQGDSTVLIWKLSTFGPPFSR